MEQAIRLIVSAATRIRKTTELKISNSWSAVHDVRPAAEAGTDAVEPVGLRTPGLPTTPDGAWMTSEPTTPRAAMQQHQDHGHAHRGQEVPEPFQAASTRSIAVGLAAASGACRWPGGAAGCDLVGHVRRPPQSPSGEPSAASRPSMLVSISTPRSTSRRARDHGDGVVVAADPGQPPGDPRGAQRHREERDREPGRVGDQQDGARGDARGRGGQAQDPAEDRADARAPARGEQQAEQEGAGVGGRVLAERGEAADPAAEALPLPAPTPATASRHCRRPSPARRPSWASSGCRATGPGR